MKKGFTIVELLMVIGIIGVLTGIVTTAASGAIKNSRVRRCDALCSIVQAGIATYYAQNNKWPVDVLNGDNISPRTNKEGTNKKDDPSKIVLRGNEVQECVRELVEETRRGQPVLDVSGLFVSRNPGKYGTKVYGLDFMSAIHGTRETSTKMKLNQMYFGYPESEHGYFRHFKIVYSIPGDSMSVTKMDYDPEMANFYE